MFFTDANTGCYHTTKDDVDAVDFAKLDQQIATACSLATELANQDASPTFVADAPVATFGDAQQMAALLDVAVSDIELFEPDVQTQITTFVSDLQAIVDAGPGVFGDDAVGVLLGGSAMLVSSIADTSC